MAYLNARLTSTSVANILAIIIGSLAGLGAVVFRYLVDVFHTFFFVRGASVLSFMGDYYVVLLPAAGGLLVGPMVFYFAREAKGHGVPEVMTSVALRGGKMRGRIAFVKTIASAITIGSGGSVGREGPIVQIGASLGSSLGQLLKLRPDLVKGLVACGAAGGISATFNAPLGGVIFALEIILGNFSTNTFVSLTLASFAAVAVAMPFFGSSPAFVVQKYAFNGAHEIPFYIMLGIGGALAAFAYVKILYFSEDLFDKIKVPELSKPIIGGLIIGSMGYYYPQLFGVGYEAMDNAIHNSMPLILLFTLIFLKIIATSVTLGSGASGGIFAPALYIGAMMGGAFGKIVVMQFPELATHAGAYALVGMGTVFAAAAQAPITAIIILFELTDDYHIILPIMISCSVSYLMFRALSRESIFTMALIRKGIFLHGGRDLNVLQDIMVRDIMGKKVEVVSEDMNVEELSNLIRITDHMGFPVTNEHGDLVGMATFNDFHYIKDGTDWTKIRIGEICTRDLIVTYPDETLDDVMQKFALKHIGRLPVVERTNPKRIIGLITRSDIVNAYSKYLTFKKY